MPTFAEIKAKASLAEATVPIVLAGEYLQRIRQMEQQLRDAPPRQSLGDRDPATVIGEQIAQLQEEMRDSLVEFQLRAMPGREWDKLKFLQPTRGKDEDEDAYLGRFFEWLCQLVARTCIDPVMTADQVAELVDLMPGSSWDALSDGAWSLNAGTVTIPFSAAASATTSASAETPRRPSTSASATTGSAGKSPRKSRRTSTTRTGG